MYDVPPLGRPLRLRGAKGVTVVLDEFAPTNLDAWLATVTYGGRSVPAVVVRHAGDVARHACLVGGRAGVPDPPSPDAVLGVVVEERGPGFVWLPPGDRRTYARDLSRRDWRELTPTADGP